MRRLLAAFAVLALALPSGASAHAFLVASTPATGASLAHAPHSVSLRFTEPVSAALTHVQLIDGRGAPIGTARVASGRTASELRITLPRLAKGAYRLTWSTVSQDDLHVTRGALAFGAGTVAPPARAAGASAPGTSLAEGAAHLIDLAALCVLIAICALLAGPLPAPVRARIGRFSLVALPALLVAGGLALAGKTSALPLRTVLAHTAWGHAMLVRELAIVAVLIAVATRRHRLAAALLVPVAAAEAASGHAASLDAAAVLAMTIHILAAGLWVGGLIVLALVLPGLERRDVLATLTRFGRLAAAGVVVLVASGLYSAGRQVASPDALLSTTYGWSLVGKLGLLAATGVLAALGLVALRRARPSLRLLRAEAIMAAGILAAASLMLSSAPARGPQFAPAARPIAGTPLASGQAADLLFDVSAAPNRPGQNFVTATILDTLRPSPGPVRRVTLTFSRGTRHVTVPATRLDATHWQVAGNAARGSGRLAHRRGGRARDTPHRHVGDALDRRLAARGGARAQGALLAARARADHDRARPRARRAGLRGGALARARAARRPAASGGVMRTALLMALAGAALLPAPASAAGMRSLIVHLDPAVASFAGVPAREVAGRLEREGRRAQAPLLAQLAALQRGGHVRHVRSLWIAGAVALTADADAIAALRARADVRSIESDSELAIQPADAVGGEPGIAAAGAPELWSHGIDGRGVTVATLDTGVDLTHAALAGRYRGGADSWFDPFGQHADPVDLNGHGTQVMGVMVAGDGIGMAPGARFIAARVFNDAGASTDSAVHLAFQWLLDPDGNPATDDAPDVVNASWGAQLATCDTEFEPDLQALRAAGILPVFAAGNDGPAAATDTSPANLPEAFAVGASASATTIASFSSIGPSRCGGGQFPALVAPGTGIRSTDRFGLDATGLAGTSFSAPHAAGALALLLQVAPQLTADAQASLLAQSAHDLGAPGPDATFGAGSLDVLAAAHILSPSLDFVPPVLSGAAADATGIRVQADDSASAIAGAEWWADADPGVGAGAAMTAADGSLDSPSEALTANAATLAPGQHTIGMRARDAAGNWSSPALLSVTVAAAPEPLQVVTPQQPSAIVITPRGRAQLVRVASDGFEHGLAAWPRHGGRVAAIRAAALSGRRGLRVTSSAGAPAFVGRGLPRASDRVELAFALDPRTLTSRTAWIEIAALTSPDGVRLATLELRSRGRGSVQLRVSARGAGGLAHSRPRVLARRRMALALSLDAGRVALAAGGHEIASLAHVAGDARAEAVVLGPRHGTPAATTGYIDIDDVTVRSAPEAS